MIIKWIGICLCLMLFWSNGTGQILNLNKKVSFNYQHKKLDFILKKIRKQQHLTFSYSNSLLPLKKKVNLVVHKTSLKTALERLFDPLAIDYVIIGNQVVLKKKTGASEIASKNNAPPDITVAIRLFDAVTKKPVPNVHLYNKGQMVGISDTTGKCVLKLADSSLVRVSFSHVGYKPARQFVIPHIQNKYLLPLSPRVERLDMVTISINRDRRWKKLFNQFKKKFLGTSANAQKCEILNPWTVEFEKVPGGIRLKNDSPDTLKIKNHALGYGLEFLLKKFQQNSDKIYYTGSCWFQQFEPVNEEQKQLWEKNRRKAYKGSFAHFLAALANNMLRKENFEMRATSLRPPASDKSYIYLPRNQVIYKDRTSNKYVLSSQYYIHVVYYGEQEEYNYLRLFKGNNPQIKPRLKPGAQESWLWLQGYSVTFDSRTEILSNAKKVLRLGYWGWEGVGEMLPTSYLQKEFMEIKARKNNRKRRKKRKKKKRKGSKH